MALKKEVKAGIIVVASLGMLLYGLNFLKGIDIFSHTKKLYAVYTDVQGLVPSNPILVNGFHVGQVANMEIVQGASGKIALTLLITDTKVKIPKNSVAKIVSAGLLGTKAVEIQLGNSTQYAVAGDTLASGAETSLKETVSNEVLPVKRKMEALMGSIDSTLAIVQGIFTKNVRTDISQSIISIHNSLQHFESTSQNIDEMMASEKTRINAIFANVDNITEALAKNSKNISKAVANLSSISDSVAKSNLKSTINNADSALYYTSQVLKKINAGKGSLGMLANDTALYKRLTYASDQLGKLLQDMKAHPKRYVHFSIFGKKD